MVNSLNISFSFPINELDLWKNLKELMKYQVNGITFTKDELRTISLDDLQLNSISPSHLFYIPASGKNAFLLLRAGDYIEEEFVEKYKAKGLSSLWSLNIANDEKIQLYRSLFGDLKFAKNEKDRQVIAQNIIKTFGEDYWKETDESFLSFALVCLEKFYFYSPEIIQKMQEKSMTLYSRAILASAFSVITSFVHQICDPYFIKDLYNAVFIMDYGLLDEDEFTYTLAFACETERNKPNQGLEYLRSLDFTDKDRDRFTNHPMKSATIAEEYKDKFFNPEVIDVIRYHHEKTDGSGFPYGISYSAMGDFETFLMFCDYIIPFGEHVFRKSDGTFIVKKAFSFLVGGEFCDQIPVKKIVGKFETAMDWAIGTITEEVKIEESAA